MIGVNKYRPTAEEKINVLHVDNTAVRESQIANLKRLRAERDQAEVDAALAALTEAARNETGNLLELAIVAARAKATVGEISEALEKVFGRYEAPVRVGARSVRRRSGKEGECAKKSADWSSSSSKPKAAGRASWWPRWVRTATTAVRR